MKIKTGVKVTKNVKLIVLVPLLQDTLFPEKKNSIVFREVQQFLDYYFTQCEYRVHALIPL